MRRLSALVALALFCLVLGIRTVDTVQGLTLKPRPLLLAAAVGIVFAGRLLLELFWWNRSWHLPKPAGLTGLRRSSVELRWRCAHRCGGSVPHRRACAGEDPPSRPAAPLPVRSFDRRPHLRHARVGAQHRGRARRPARPWLCRLLRRRRLQLCASCDEFRLGLLDVSSLCGTGRRRCGAAPSAFPCSASGATISPSSRSPSPRSCASSCSIGRT